MSEIGFFIWKLSNMPENPADLAAMCRSYGISRLAIKVLEGRWKFNVPSQSVDAPLMAYIRGLRDGGITVEGWGYHYPEQPGLQGDAIEERRAKLEFSTYHIDIEGEWKKPFGMPAAMKAMLDKLKVGSEYLFCSYRYPSMHAAIPWFAAMLHPAIDGASPQMYWQGAHNPAEQLQRSWDEYIRWGKQFHPIGSAYGQGNVWSPTVEDFAEFTGWCTTHSIRRHYWWSMDWVLTHGRYDWLKAITGRDGTPTPPPERSDLFLVANCAWANVRSDASSAEDNRVATVRAGQHVSNLHQQSGLWERVGLGPIEGWIHGDYTEAV